jgi:hypothetical protein
MIDESAAQLRLDLLSIPRSRLVHGRRISIWIARWRSHIGIIRVHGNAKDGVHRHPLHWLCEVATIAVYTCVPAISRVIFMSCWCGLTIHVRTLKT